MKGVTEIVEKQTQPSGVFLTTCSILLSNKARAPSLWSNKFTPPSLRGPPPHTHTTIAKVHVSNICVVGTSTFHQIQTL